MMRRIDLFLALMVCLLCLLPAGAVRAEDGGYEVYIVDDADLLTDEEEDSLYTVMKPVTQYGNAIFLTHTEDNSNSDQFAREWYHAYFGTNSGTLFMIDMYNRNITVFSDGANYKTVNDQYALTITDNVYRYATKGDYFGCAKAAFTQIADLLENGRIFQPMKILCSALLALTLGILFNFYILKSNRGSLKASSATGAAVRAAAIPVLVTSTLAANRLVRSYRVESSSSSGGGGGGGGGSFGGGGGGGGSSGGGGSHGF